MIACIGSIAKSGVSLELDSAVAHCHYFRAPRLSGGGAEGSAPVRESECTQVMQERDCDNLLPPLVFPGQSWLAEVAVVGSFPVDGAEQSQSLDDR